MSRRRQYGLLRGSSKELEFYVREIADLMGLRDWTVHLRPGDPEEENHKACAQVTFGRRYVNLWFRRGWWTWSPAELRSAVVHELLHAHLNPVGHSTINNVAHLIGHKPYLVAWEAMTLQLELATDAIAEAWAVTLPLPIKEAEG
jgi:hypothetical protein